MSKKDLEKEIMEMLSMIFHSYSCLNHYQVELIENTLKHCLNYLNQNL